MPEEILSQMIQGLVDLGDLIRGAKGTGVAAVSEIIRDNLGLCQKINLSLGPETKQRVFVYCLERVEANLAIMARPVATETLEHALENVTKYVEVLRWLDQPSDAITIH